MVFSLLSFRPRPLARPACASPPWPQFALRGAGECGTKGRGHTALSLWFQNRRRLRHAGTCVEGRAEGERSSEMVAIPAGPCEAPNTWALHLRGPDSAKARKRALQSTPQSDAAQGRRSVENLGFSAVRFWLFSFFVCSDGTRPPLRDAGLRCRFRWRPRRVSFFPECFPSPGLKLLLPVFAPGLGFGGRAHRWDKPRQVEGRRGRK